MQTSFGTRPELDDLTFSAFGYQMAQHFQDLPTVNDAHSDKLLDAARRWLDEATGRPNHPDMGVWGRVCHGVLRHHAGTIASAHFVQDRNRVAAYLNAMSSIDDGVLLATARLQRAPSLIVARTYYERPAVDALLKVLKIVVEPGTALSRDGMLLRTLLEDGQWQLSSLIERLHGSRESLAAYATEASGGSSQTPSEELPSSFGPLYYLACQAVVETSWRPQDSTVYRPLWGHLGCPGMGDAQRTKLIATLRSSMPRQDAAGLANVSTRASLTSDQVNAFFPIRWMDASLPELAENLIRIYAMGRMERPDRIFSEIRTGALFENKLAQEHPELHRALCIHFVLFPDSSQWETNADSLVEVFRALLGVPMAPVETYSLPSLDGS